MLKSGAEHLASLRDGRRVFIGSEPVADVTSHPAFRNAAHTVASIYDLKAAPENRDTMSFEDEGRRHSVYFLRSRTQADLALRTGAHRKIADLTYGMLGRSPDHVASFVTGMAMNPAVFGKFAENIVAYYHHMREHDIYAAYAVAPPAAARNPEFYQKKNIPVPTLRVVREEDDGVVISGMKMLATGAILANEIWIGNVLPLAAEFRRESITCAVPCNAPGLVLWSRKPLEPYARNEFDAPLTARFDETDAMVLCEEVKVPWERVFVHDDAILSRRIYVETPAHAFGNHQSNVRFAAKLRLIVGVASRVAQSSGSDQVPAVRETLGRLAALEATLEAMIAGQLYAAESWPAGYMTFNRRFMYAALNWCTEGHSAIIDCLRELCGGGVLQMPADDSVIDAPAMRELFETYWSTPQMEAGRRMRLFKLAWDLVGSEFAGRHQQYEKFYAGASFIVRNYSFMTAPWDEFHALADGLLER
ncbi:MAG TPA: 4-hydroxyphenylacetate 3-hydroxylase N-terminal domain-containing protein [Candidatus Binataceae bacterium]|nr:4-hydroxyphenylacetate 3-hydroxylase N-terminal domain-containing protein [Candidatus Binataceae bacterium]